MMCGHIKLFSQAFDAAWVIPKMGVATVCGGDEWPGASRLSLGAMATAAVSQSIDPIHTQAVAAEVSWGDRFWVETE